MLIDYPRTSVFNSSIETLFSPRLGPPYSSRKSYLSGQKVWRKGVENHSLIEGKCFTEMLILFTPTISYTHLLYPRFTFLWHILYFPLHMHSPITHVIICFGRIIIDIIILWNEKRCVLFLEGKEMTSTENSDLTDRRLHKRIKLTIQSGEKIHEKKLRYIWDATRSKSVNWSPP